MDYEAWQLKRRALQDVEKAERSINWTQSRAPIQAAITEQAVRELYDRVAALEAKRDEYNGMVARETSRLAEAAMKRGPGRPPKEAE